MSYNMAITTRLRIMGALLVAVVGLIGSLGYFMVGRMDAAVSEISGRGILGSKLLADVNNTVWELRFGIANYTLATPENRKKILDARPGHYRIFEENLKKYEELGFQAETGPVVKDLLAAYEKYKAGAPKWFELIDADKLPEAAEFRAQVTNAAGAAMVKGLSTLIEKQAKINQELEKPVRTVAERAKALLLAIGSAALLIVIVLVTLTGRAVSRPLGQMQAEIEDIEKNCDFSRRVTICGNSEIGRTAESFNRLMATAHSSLRDLLASVERVSKAATTLSGSSDQVARGSEQQSGAATSIASTLEELSASINNVSDNARNALSISTDSSEFAGRGQDIIQKAVAEILLIAETMRQASGALAELSQQSNNVSSVVQVIREVADQTNLLALNAAIEAARAGEQGRGFAVVADEVRKLAERTSKSTTEITGMIGGMQNSADSAVSNMESAVNQMDGGVALAKQAGKSIDQIKDGAIQATTVVKEISAALQEQSSASSNISTLISNVAEMAEKNSSATNEIATATRDLLKLADEMRTVGSRFKV